MSIRRSHGYNKSKHRGNKSPKRSLTPVGSPSESVGWRTAQNKWRQGDATIYHAEKDQYYMVSRDGTRYYVFWSRFDIIDAKKFLKTASEGNSFMSYTTYMNKYYGQGKTWQNYQEYIDLNTMRPIDEDHVLSREEFIEMNGSDDYYQRYLDNITEDNY